MRIALRAPATVVLATILLLLPFLAHAQTAQQDALRATIRAALLSDPRSAHMTDGQLDGLVNALASQASKQGMTAQNIAWRPYAPQSVTVAPAPVAPECWGFPTIFCSLDSAYGFAGTDPWVPLVFFAAAAGFFVVVALMREHGHPHAQFEIAILH
jgi:hypothetical protein